MGAPVACATEAQQATKSAPSFSSGPLANLGFDPVTARRRVAYGIATEVSHLSNALATSSSAAADCTKLFDTNSSESMAAWIINASKPCIPPGCWDVIANSMTALSEGVLVAVCAKVSYLVPLERPTKLLKPSCSAAVVAEC